MFVMSSSLAMAGSGASGIPDVGGTYVGGMKGAGFGDVG
jgi:hypothetical protein